MLHIWWNGNQNSLNFYVPKFAYNVTDAETKIYSYESQKY